jgi:23S rRNA pseudouridine1911/1915/1917 synthase
MKQENTMEKEYLTILTGLLDEKSGTIDAPIARKPDSIMERVVNESGQTAITHYKVLEECNLENLSLVQVKLETGRTHQIRVHFAYKGHSILGDTLYDVETSLINRQALHAWRLSFVHPMSKEQILIVAPLPEDMKKVLEKININKF